MGAVRIGHLRKMGTPPLTQNHVQCEVKRGRYDRNAEYLCSECERKTRRKRLPVIESLELGRAGKEKKQVELPQAQRAHIFDIRKDNYHYL
jgi:hypothetical protein